jgi:hypothetical protein
MFFHKYNRFKPLNFDEIGTNQLGAKTNGGHVVGTNIGMWPRARQADFVCGSGFIFFWTSFDSF